MVPAGNDYPGFWASTKKQVQFPGNILDDSLAFDPSQFVQAVEHHANLSASDHFPRHIPPALGIVPIVAFRQDGIRQPPRQFLPAYCGNTAFVTRKSLELEREEQKEH